MIRAYAGGGGRALRRLACGWRWLGRLAAGVVGVPRSSGRCWSLLTLLRRPHASRVGALLLLVPAVTALASAPALGEPLQIVRASPGDWRYRSRLGCRIARRAARWPVESVPRARRGLACTDVGLAIGGRPGAEAPALEWAPTSAPPANDASPATTAGTRTQRGMSSSQPPGEDGNPWIAAAQTEGGPVAPLATGD